MDKKICSCCKVNKNVSEFYKNNKTKSGYTSRCKKCIKEKARVWAKNNPEKRVLSCKNYELRNRKYGSKDEFIVLMRTLKKGNKYRLGMKHREESKVKMSEAKRGKYIGCKSPSWRGGLTSLGNSIRKSIKYKEWRTKIFERDNYVCRESGQVGGELHAHHKVSFADIIFRCNIRTYEDAMNCDFLWDIDNGITLSKKCHEGRK